MYTYIQTNTHIHTHTQKTMSFTLPTQAALNGATYEQLNALMEMVYNTYKLEGFSWDKASKEFLVETCKAWDLKASGKKEDLQTRLQEAQLALGDESEGEEDDEEDEEDEEEQEEQEEQEGSWADGLKVKDLKEICKEEGLKPGTRNKDELVTLIATARAATAAWKATTLAAEPEEERPKKKAKVNPAEAAAKAILAENKIKAPKKVTKKALREEAKSWGVKGYTTMTPDQLIDAIAEMREAKLAKLTAPADDSDLSDSDSDSSDDEDEEDHTKPVVWSGTHIKFD